ncbi:hypothetical protein AB0J57_25130 [Streptomyces sp. NPDC049837]|uniref:hypothetical protein n=1 Tax=Streptomyces sp. NPDC049837 TaxID=3155277 RepID=UPI00343B7F21
MTITATRNDRRMYMIMNQDAGTAMHATAARRRLVVGAHIALTVASVAAWLGAVHGVSVWYAFAILALLAPWCVAMGVINGSTRGLLQLRGHMLDERQLVERDRVRAIAHRITVGLLFAGAAGTGLATWLGEVRFDGALLFPALFALLVTHWLLPSWVACLRVQDDAPDEVEEALHGN